MLLTSLCTRARCAVVARLTPNSRSYITQFSQPDTIVPDLYNSQSYDRYSYVNNNPLRYTDPTGHIGCDEDLEGHCINPYEKILNSAVYLIFGRHGEGRKTIGYETGGSGGIGIVVGDKTTIVTAEHVYKKNIATQDTVFIQVNGEWIEYDLADVTVAAGPGDLATLALPSDLPGYVVPASQASDYHSESGQSVVPIYAEPKNEGNKLAGFSLHAAQTTTDDPVVDNPDTPGVEYGNQLMILNPNQVLNSGDSGGGVFYNRRLIGVNSSISGTQAAVAPLCFNWYLRRFLSSAC